jgi:predicted MFS family arabinose efflux permease
MGWRNAFYVAGVPGLLFGLLAWFYVKPSTAESKGEKNDSSLNISELLQYNNIKWGIPAACCVFGWWFATLPFISKYFVETQGMSADQMGKTMGLLGVSGLVSSVIVPALSDKIGRKPVLLVAISIGILYPFAVYFLNGSGLQMPAMFITYCMMGTIPIIAAVIPSATVPDHLKAKAIGLVTAIGEIVGGVLIPALAGILSDSIDPSAFLWVSSGLAALAVFFVSKLK